MKHQHLHIHKHLHQHNPQTIFKSSVWVTESLGSEKLVYVKNGQNTIVTRLDPRVEIRVGETAEFVVRMAFSHIFDGETEKTVY